MQATPEMHTANVSKDNLIWIDLEMTGLNPDTDRIIEIATIITDSQLNILAEGPMLAVHQTQAVMDGMDEWNTKQHGKSGLTARVLASQLDEAEAERQTIAFLEQWVPKGASPICGNSIGQDRRFLWRGMPTLEAYFHYRNLDVSTVKELARRWKPEVADGVKKMSAHLALDDIRDSIAELQHYRQHFFIA
jgi:oligoribonuclease